MCACVRLVIRMRHHVRRKRALLSELHFASAASVSHFACVDCLVFSKSPRVREASIAFAACMISDFLVDSVGVLLECVISFCPIIAMVAGERL